METVEAVSERHGQAIVKQQQGGNRKCEGNAARAREDKHREEVGEVYLGLEAKAGQSIYVALLGGIM